MVYTKRQRIDVWMDAATAKTLTNRFGYCFKQAEGSGYPALFNEHRIEKPFREIKTAGAGGDIIATPFRQIHGSIDSLGFRIGDVAYSSDISELPEESFDAISRLDCWIVDALRRDPHPTHFHLEKALEMIDRFKPQQAILTNLHIDLDYATLLEELPSNIVPAYDGLEYCCE